MCVFYDTHCNDNNTYLAWCCTLRELSLCLLEQQINEVIPLRALEFYGYI